MTGPSIPKPRLVSFSPPERKVGSSSKPGQSAYKAVETPSLTMARASAPCPGGWWDYLPLSSLSSTFFSVLLASFVFI